MEAVSPDSGQVWELLYFFTQAATALSAEEVDNESDREWEVKRSACLSG